MTVSHCSIVAYTYRATFSSRASPHDLAPGRRDQFRQLIERFINAPGVLRLELHPNEKHPLGLAIDSVD